MSPPLSHSTSVPVWKYCSTSLKLTKCNTTTEIEPQKIPVLYLKRKYVEEAGCIISASVSTLSVLHTASCFQLLHAYRRSAFHFFFGVLSFFYKCQTKLVRWEAAKQGKIKPRILNLGTPYFQQSDPVVPVLGGHRFNSPVWQYELWFEDCDTMSRVSPSHFLLHLPPSSHK